MRFPCGDRSSPYQYHQQKEFYLIFEISLRDPESDKDQNSGTLNIRRIKQTAVSDNIWFSISPPINK